MRNLLRRLLPTVTLVTVLGLIAPTAAAAASTDPTPEASPSPTTAEHGPEDSGPTEPLTIEPWDEPLVGAQLEASVQTYAARALTPPAWRLPFQNGQKWASGGPHRDSDGTAWGALDFTPQGSNKKVVAIAEGRVYRVTCPKGWFLGIDHGGGWRSEYYHLTNAQSKLIGQWVPAGAYLGDAGNTLPCGGSSNGAHVHMSILYGDPPQPGNGLRPYYPVDGMRFGNYTVRAGKAVNQGTWKVTSTGKPVITNWGCCLTSTTPAPKSFSSAPGPTISGTVAVGKTLTAKVSAWSPAASFAYQWKRDGASIGGATSATYTVTKKDRGAKLTVAVTGARSGYWRVTRTSGAVTVPTPVVRAAGVDRYATAAAVSREAFPDGADVVYLASGRDFPDAVAASAAAGAADGPVLLTLPTALPSSTTTEIRRLSPDRIVVVGGTGVISSGVASAAKKLTGTVSRSSGSDRYATAAALSKAEHPNGADVVYLASGADFPDALSASAPAAAAGAPVLLTSPAKLSASTATELRRLSPREVVIVGGTGAVSTSVQTAVDAIAGKVTRLAGADRYATAVVVAAASAPSGSKKVYVASGAVYADALSAAAAAGAGGYPVLLVRPAALPTATGDLVAKLAPTRIVVAGGTGAVAESVARALAARAP